MLETIRASYNRSLIHTQLIDVSMSVDNIAEQLESFKIKDVKIVRAVMIAGHGKVICAAYRAGLMTSDYVWFSNQWTWELILDSLPDYCTTSEISRIKSESNGLLSITLDPSSIKGVDSDVGITSEQVFEAIPEAKYWDLYVYDCFWIIAKCIDSFISEKTTQQKLESFMTNVDRVSFYGVSGLVRFDGLFSSTSQLQLQHLVDFSETVKISQFSSESYVSIETIYWKSGAVPTDFTQKTVIRVIEKTVTVNKVVALVCCTCAGLCILLCICIAVINFIYKNEPIIKITSPIINNFILMGSVLLFLCVVAMSSTAATIDTDIFLASCNFYLISINLGFTTTFGALFAKTWRVYKAFTQFHAQKLIISDLQLVVTILILIGLDAIILTLAMIFDPMGYELIRTHRNTELLNELTVQHYHYNALKCTMNSSVFFYIFGGTKALILLFGGFLAFETRNVNIEALNDSKSIAICMYNFFISTCVGVVFNFVLDWDQNETYILLGPLILIVALFPILVLFTPRHLKLALQRQPIQVNVRNSAIGANAKVGQHQAN